MRNIRATVMLVLSLLVGLGAAAMAAAWVQQKGNAATRQVAVAATDIELGSRLNEQMVKLVAWPAGQVPEGSFENADDLADRVVKTSVLRGEAILESKLAPVGTKGGLSAVIKEGDRAMTVRVNDVVGVAGFALPGNYVDVVVSTQQDGSGNENRQISKIVLEHILVLAVAQEANRDDTKPKVVNAVTLEVTPAEAEKLDLARSVGSLSLVLRNQVDARAVDTAGVTKRQLLVGDERRAAEPAKAPAARPARQHAVAMRGGRDCVEVVAGGTKSVQCF
ncbi:MAG TPA: Flp pilus assembly protein CpaB [Rhodocyclaceae bacterium]